MDHAPISVSPRAILTFAPCGIRRSLRRAVCLFCQRHEQQTGIRQPRPDGEEGDDNQSQRPETEPPAKTRAPHLQGMANAIPQQTAEEPYGENDGPKRNVSIHALTVSMIPLVATKMWIPGP